MRLTLWGNFADRVNTRRAPGGVRGEAPRRAPCGAQAPGRDRPAGLPAALSRRVAPVRQVAVVALVAVAALFALPLQAQAQTLTTLVSNTGETLDSGSTGSIVAQNFRTGANADGYTISEVDIRLHAGSGSTSTSVSIRKNTSGEPGDLVAALTNPSPLSRNSLNTFTAPVGTRLDASTTYWITVSEGISNRAPLSLTFSNAQTGEQGWRIGNDRLYRSSDSDDWTTSESALVIAIKGIAGITASTDATLSDLTLTDDDGNAISLTPTFVSVTTSYMASVANRIDAVTLTAATQNDSNAMVAITSDDDTTSPGEAVLPLTVGSNTLTVTVTAEDGSTMETYTVAVTRGVPVPVDIEPNYDTIGAGLEDLVFTLTREGAATDELEAMVTIVQEQTWLGNSDLSKTVTFVAGSATATLTLGASRFSFDPDTSGDLTATVSGTGIAGGEATVQMVSTADAPITVSYDKSSYTFAEDATDVEIYVLVALDPAYPRAPSRSFYLSFTSASDTAISPGDYGIISWQPQFVQGDFALDVSKFVARKRLRDTGGAYFGVEDDDVYEGSERLVVILERSPNLPSGLVQFVRPNGDICEALSCSPRVEYPVTITDEEDRPVLSLSAEPASLAEEDDDTTTSVTENVSVLTVAAASPKTFATDQAITLTFAGIAVYGTHYSVNPADTDANATGHQVLLPAETASVEVTVTAAANDTDDGHRSILVTGSRDGTAFGTATTITLLDDETTTSTDVSIAAEYDTIGAGLDDLVFTLSREGPTTDELEVTLTIVQDQLWLSAGRLAIPRTFPVGSATMTQTFGVFDFSFDPAVSGNLTATVTGTGISSKSTIVNVISIAEPPVTIAYDEIEYSFTEDGLPADINIYVVATLNPAYPRPPQHAFHVDVYSESDTAIYLEDYRGFGERTQFGREDFALEGGKYVARKRVQLAGGTDFAVVNDAVYEGTERFFAKLEHTSSQSGLLQFVYPDGDTCEASVCSPVVKYPVYITDEEDLPILSLSAYPISISGADDDTTPDITENVSTLDVAITNAKTFAKEQTFTLDFSGSAVYGTHYTVGPLDTDTTSPGHQAVLQAKTASAPITITALDNADVEGGHTIEVQGSLDGTTFVTGARITISDDDGTITPATITDVALTNLPSDGVYDLGEIVEVSITFSEAVAVTDAPRVRMRLVVSDAYAAYVASASTATVLVFRYTVTGATDDEPDGIRVFANGLELNGGTIRNQGTAVDADLAHGAVTGLPMRTRLVEDIAITSTPRVPATDSGGTPTYGPGEVIEFTVTFGDTVEVTGTPILKGATSEAGQYDAEYAGGTGSTALRFEWTVPASLPAPAAIWIYNNIIGFGLDTSFGLVLQGATLTDSDGRPVNIRHEDFLSLGNVDAAPPVLSSDTSGATVDGVRLELIYRRDATSQSADWLDTSSTPAPGDFTVTVDGTEVAVSTVEVADEETVRLTLSEAVQSDDIVTIDYTPGANPIKDLWGNKAIAVNSRAVRNDTTTTNTAATGMPTISGTAQVGEILMALTSGISDADGLPASFTYQWVRVDSDGTSTETGVGSNSNSYSPTAADVGKKIRVKVSFTDNAGNSEGPLTSDAYPASGTIAPASTTPPPDTDLLVSNTGEALANGVTSSINAQSFVTGFNAGGYTISAVQIRLKSVSGKTTVVRIREDDNGNPGDLVATLTNPASLSSYGINMFTAPPGTTLAASTTYWITTGEGIFILSRLTSALTGATAEIGEPGWSIGDGRLYRSRDREPWYTSTQSSLMIAIKGTAIGAASDDATLGALTVNDGTSDLTLDPAFAPGTFAYAAEVGNAVTTVTLTAMATDDGASVSAVTLNGTAITDRDFTNGITVPSLLAGDNGIVVTVTAENGDTRTYTVTVTRAENTADTPGVTVSETALTVTEQDTTGDSYTVVLDTEPTANVTVTVAGHSGTDVTANPGTLTFTASNWDTARTVTVTAGDDADTTDDSVTLTHSAASTDNDYSGIAIDEVAVTVSDNDTAVAAGICGRTPAVRDELLRLIENNEGTAIACADVTATHLAAITRTLDLSGQNIAELTAGDFAGLTSLTNLYLFNNALTTLPDDVFDDLTALEILTLGRNDLPTLPAGVFDRLIALTELGLDNNALSSLPGGVFDELGALDILVLAHNGLTTLPGDVFDALGALTELNLQDNALTGLTAGVFDRLRALEVLTLDENGLTTLPDGVFDRLGALEVLTLDGNGLTGLPDGVFDRLGALEVLTLRRNGLAKLPGRVFEPLTALKDLRLQGNPGVPFAPEAVALPDDGTVPVAGGAVTLDGSDGGAWGTNVTYSWALPPPVSGVTVTIDDDTSAMPVVTIPALPADTELIFTLTVSGVGGTDGIDPATDTARVTVTRAASAGVSVSPTALTVTEEDLAGAGYTVVLDTLPMADVTVTVAGHARTDLTVTPDPATLTFTSTNWSTAQTVTVAAGDDEDTTDDTVTLTHSAESTDGNYNDVEIADVAVTVTDNDLVQVTGVEVEPGNARLAVSWTAVGNATGYKVQWKSGSENYDTTDRQATIALGSTTSHTITGLVNATRYTVRVSATRTGASDGPPSAEAMGRPRGESGGICGRTPAVRDALLDLIEENDGRIDCANVSAADLAAITGRLDLSGQGIAALKAGDFAGLTGLTQLYLYGNALSSLPGGVFAELSALNNLDLNNNNLSSLPVGVFARLTALTNLTLFNNELTTLPAGVFAGLSSLRALSLDGNGLTALPGGVFADLTELGYLNLDYNNLTTLPGRVFEPLTALTDLQLVGNDGAPFAPAAVALPDGGTVPAGGMVTLDGSGSGGAWGTNVTYDWALTTPVSGVTFDDNTSATPVVTIPVLAADVELTFTLTVTGGGGAKEKGVVTGADTATVTVTPAARSARAAAIPEHDEAESPTSPPLVSVANAKVREGRGAMLAFNVMLDRASRETAMVDWETLNGSGKAGAKAGQDYVADSGTLVFAPGETVKTVNVAVLDDAHDERQEVMLLLLSNAQGAVIGDAVAKGTIENSDRMPAAWLTRFGRAASDHVVEAVGERWQGGPRASHLTIGGRRAGNLFGWAGLGGQAERDTADDRDEPVGTDPSSIGLFAPSGADGAGLGATAPGMGVSGMDAMRVGPGGVEREAGRTLSGRAAQGALLRALGLPDPRAVPDLRTVLMSSSFFYSAALDDDGRARSPGRTRSPGWLGEWSAWGRTAATRFQGNDEGMALDGEVATAMLGFDSRWDRWLAGVVVSYSEGQGAYTHPTASGGAVKSTMTGLHPYARFELNERTSFWGVLGYGAGELSLTPERSATALGTDLTNAMAAFGGRTALSVRAGRAGRFELAVRSDARLTSTASDAIEGLAGAAGQTGRVRLMLEGSGSMPLATGGVLKPTLEAGLRYDAGDAETGAGLEVSGGLGYAAGRLSVEINARGLLAHEDTGYEEWGFSGSIAYTPSEDGRGLSMRLGSAWGATQSGVQSLWSRQDASGLVRNAAFDAAQRYQVELRYGFDGRKGHARWEPYVGVESGDGSSRALRLGVTLTSGRGLDAGLELGRRQGLPGADPEHAVQLRGALRW